MTATENNQSIIFEGITSVSALINAADAGICRRRILRVIFDRSKLGSERRRASFLKAAAARQGFEFVTADTDYIASLAEGRTHGGILCEATPAEYRHIAPELIPENGFCVYLDGAEDPYTLGNSIRSLWCCGADCLITPRLPDGADATVARSSAGTSELLPVYLSEGPVIPLFAAAGYTCVCAEIRDSVPCNEAVLKRPVLLICGGEKRGIASKISEGAAFNVRIPYGRDFMGSMSSSSAVSVLAYEIMNQNAAERR